MHIPALQAQLNPFTKATLGAQNDDYRGVAFIDGYILYEKWCCKRIVSALERG